MQSGSRSCLGAGQVAMQHEVSGPVSAAVTFHHQYRLVLVAALSGLLQAFHVSLNQSSLR